MVKKYCITCSQEFEAKSFQHKYCTPNCRPNQRPKTSQATRQLLKSCLICGEALLNNPKINNRSQTCSSECNETYRKRTMTIDYCKLCGERIEKVKRPYGKYHFCTKNCRDKWLKYTDDVDKKVQENIRKELLAESYKVQLNDLKKFIRKFYD